MASAAPMAVMVCRAAATFAGPHRLAQGAAQERIDLAERLAAGKLRAVNRSAARLEGTPGGIHVSEAAGNGVLWVEGSDFANGTLEVDVRGRDVLQQSFLGIAFHRTDDAAATRCSTSPCPSKHQRRRFRKPANHARQVMDVAKGASAC